MIKFIPNKRINHKNVKKLLSFSEQNNQFTNYGPLVKKLEFRLREICEINDDRAVIVVNNGASALHALCSSMDVKQFTTTSFTFPCSVQGPLKNSRIIDIDSKSENNDNFICTNLFGHICVNYSDYSSKNLICDNATAPLTKLNGVNINNLCNSIISLHHTKPLGFGEGGAIFCEKQYEDKIRRIINFGFNENKQYLSEGNNFKMSDVSAAYILDRFSNYGKIYKKHIELYSYFIDKHKSYFPIYDEIPFASTIPILSEINFLDIFVKNGIEAKKYYKPLINSPNSVKLYNQITCLPLHEELNFRDVDRYIEIIRKNS